MHTRFSIFAIAKFSVVKTNDLLLFVYLAEEDNTKCKKHSQLIKRDHWNINKNELYYLNGFLIKWIIVLKSILNEGYFMKKNY